MNENKQNLTYPLLGLLCSLIGTGALLARANNGGSLLIWGILLLASGVLWATAVVEGTREETVQRPNPKHRTDPNAPETIELRLHRIPSYPLLLALAAAVAVGIYTKSALDGMLTFFTWGFLGYVLANCILRKHTFGSSMQTGLIASVIATSLAGVIHVFKVSADGSFRLQYCFDIAQTAVREKLAEAFQSAINILQSQGIDTTGTIFSIAPQTLAEELTYSLMLSLPALFALLILAALCVTWWGSKELLKRNPSVEVKHMGRLDGYVPGRAVTIFYFATYIFYLLASDSTTMSAIGRNLHSVASTVLVFAGFSLALFLINTRTASKPLRVLLAVLILFFAFDSCGSQLLIFAGMFSANLRQAMSGGALK